MKKTLTALTLTSLIAIPVHASGKNDTEGTTTAVGMGTGAIIGTVIAGPPGGIFGALLGTFMGSTVEKAEQLKLARAELDTIQNELFAMHDELKAMQHQASLTRVSYEPEQQEKVLAVESSIQFKTASVEVEPAYHQQLERIASALVRHPMLKVRLTGHADSRGDETYNQALSMQRALNVKRFLNHQGVSDTQVVTIAVGETKSQGESYEETFFDRKVVLEIAQDDDMLTAKR